MFSRRRVSSASLNLLLVLAAVTATACRGPARITLPTGAGTPFPGFADAYSQATADCRAIKTMSASLSLSGRTGSTKLAARIDAGFAEPARVRLEGYPRVNFGGKPFFVLVATGAEAVLVLTRDDRVLRGAAPSAIVEALAGVALDPYELRSVVSGCALGSVVPTGGRSFGNGWAAVDAGDTTLYLREQDRRWRLLVAQRGSLTIEYSNFAGARPTTVRLHMTPGSGLPGSDLTLGASQVEINVPLEDPVFNADVPPTATPLTLEELRRALKTTEGAEGTGQDQHGDAEARIRRAARGGTGPSLPPCPRASVLISSRAPRRLRLPDLRPLRPRALRPLRSALA